MQELTGNLWDSTTWKRQGQKYDFRFDAIAITTNGACDKYGNAVMGRGCAKEAVQEWPTFKLSTRLGKILRVSGNHVALLVNHQDEPILYSIISFPVKCTSAVCKEDKSNVLPRLRSQFRSGSLVPGWATYSSMELILQSSHELIELLNKENFDSVILPRPGCGNGGLNWVDVKKEIEKILDDRVYIISF